MEKQFVPYELAVRLKELGFDEPCIAYYVGGEDRFIYDIYTVNNFSGRNILIGECIATPLWQQAFDWFRVNHNLMGNVQYFINSYFCYTIDNMEGKRDSNRLFTEYETYQEARQACLEKLIEITDYKD